MKKKKLCITLSLLFCINLFSQVNPNSESKSMNIGQSDYQPYTYAPGIMVWQTVIAQLAINDADAAPGLSLFTISASPGDFIDPTGATPGWKEVFIIHDFLSKPNPPTPNAANLGKDFEVINHGLTLLGTPADPGHFRGNIIGDGTYTLVVVDDPATPQNEDAYLTINKDYFPEDDPATPNFNEETFMPYVQGGLVPFELINENNIVLLAGDYETEAKTGPNVNKLDLPENLVSVRIKINSANPFDIEIVYFFKNVCAYHFDIDREIVTQVREVVVDPNQAGAYISAPNLLVANKLGDFEHEFGDNDGGPNTICGRPTAQFIDEYIPKVYAYADYDIRDVHAVLSNDKLFNDENGDHDPTKYYSMQYDYPTYLVEAYRMENGSRQWAGSYETPTFPFVPSNPEEVVPFSLSVFYLWDGFYEFDLTPLNTYGVEGETVTVDLEITTNSSYARSGRSEKNKSQQHISRIYPNPSDDAGFNIELSGLKETSNNFRVNIYDLLGKEVYSERLNAGGVNQIIHFNEDGSLQAGFYLVSIDVNGETFNEKIQVK